MSAPVVTTIRPGVTFTPAAAASFRRAEAAWVRRTGDVIDVNSTYRDYDKQFRMYTEWNAYVAGRGPYPGHSRAIHPDLSMHCKGLALDSDDWTRPGFNELMAEHGWIRTAASDPTERHHFEYQWWRDQHRNDPAPAGGVLEIIREGTDETMWRIKAKYYYIVGINDVEKVSFEEAQAMTAGANNGERFAVVSSAQARLLIDGAQRREKRRLRRIAAAMGGTDEQIAARLEAAVADLESLAAGEEGFTEADAQAEREAIAQTVADELDNRQRARLGE